MHITKFITSESLHGYLPSLRVRKYLDIHWRQTYRSILVMTQLYKCYKT